MRQKMNSTFNELCNSQNIMDEKCHYLKEYRMIDCK